jgi:hypothetical protein
MAMNPTTFAKDVSLNLFQPAWRKALKESCWDSSAIYDARESDQASEQVFGTAPLGSAMELGFSDEVPFLDIEELAASTWTHATFMMGARIPMQLIEDGKYVPYTKLLASDLARGHTHARDHQKVAPFNLAWTTALWDGLPLISTTHVTTKTAETINNDLGSVSCDFDSMWDAMGYFSYGILDEAGLPYWSKPKGVLYHPSIARDMAKMTGNEWEPDTGFRNANTLKQKYGDLVNTECQMLAISGGTYPWFVYSDKAKQDAIFYNRISPKVDQENEFTRYGLMFRSRSRSSAGFRDYREFAGSAG